MTCLMRCQVVGVVNGGAIDDRVFAMAVVVDGQQRSLGRVDMEPLRKEHVDLVNVLLE